MTCRHLPLESERDVVIVVDQHVDPCAAEWDPALEGNCGGCWPCDERHCNVCTSHLDTSELGTCTTCRGTTRRTLIDVADLAALLPDQALNGGHTGHLDAAADIPGGDALVLMSRGSEGISDDDMQELLPPSYVLAWWWQTWTEAKGEDPRSLPGRPRPAALLVHAYAYLARNLDWAASNYPGFHAFARDLTRLRTQLEDRLHAGEQSAEGVPCFVCGADLARTYRDPKPCDCPPKILRYLLSHHLARHDQPGLCCLGCAWTMRHQLHDQGGDTTDDPLAGWSCPRCQRAYSPGEYQLAVSVLATQHAPALPATELAERIGVNASTIWRWARDGHIQKRGRGADNRQLYDVADAVRHAARGAHVANEAPEVMQ